ncbi:MAG TPA: oligosaccharide flippase family protein [Thermoanaerobaculia bacterium]
MPPSRLRWNAAANLAGTAWASLLGIALVPLYLRYLGIEAYALVGLYTVIQTSLTIFDLGLGLTVTRGMARLSVKPDAARAQRDLLRSVEVVYWSVAAILGAAIFFAAGPIARYWIRPGALPLATVVMAVRLMGLVNAFAFPVSLYRAALLGLDRQVVMNGVMITLGTIRGLGAVLVLIVIAPAIQVFFAWQAVATAALTATLAFFAWRSLRADVLPQFRRDLLREEWPYALRVSSALVLNMFLANIDKILLSGILPLAAFGYYALAATLAQAPLLVSNPLNTAVFPRFTRLFETRNEEEMAALYHTTTQAAAVLVLPGSALLAAFAPVILRLWTRNPAAAANGSIIATILVCATALVAVVSVSGYLASAGGRPQVMTQVNLAAAAFIVPAMMFVAPRYGAPGAALVWASVGAFHLLGAVPLTHRYFLPREMWRWYVDDLAKPLLAIAALLIPARLWLPWPHGALLTLFELVAIFAACTIAAVLATSRVRALALRLLRVRPASSSRPR